jgi:tetratricopeptide (TPR) repeat protein
MHVNLFSLARKELEVVYEACKRGLEKWPQDPNLNLLFAAILDAMDREEEGLGYHKKHVALDPFSFRSNNYIYRSYYNYHGDLDNALIHLERMRERWGDIEKFTYHLWEFYRTQDTHVIAGMETQFDDRFWITTAHELQVKFGLIRDLPRAADVPNEQKLESINAYRPFMYFMDGKPELAREKALEILQVLGIESDEVTWESLLQISIGPERSNRLAATMPLDRYYRHHIILLLPMLGWLEQSQSILKKVEQEANEMVFNITRIHDNRYFCLQLLSWMDPEAAVELLFHPQANHNLLKRKWELATDYLLNQMLLQHPRVMEMMVEDGDWVDYLAERIPEYEKYKIRQ